MHRHPLPLGSSMLLLLAATVALAPSPSLAGPAGPADPPGQRLMTVAGSLQDELGCPGDWQPDCAETDLREVAPDVYRARFTLPAGAYEFKIAVDHSWDENYGAGGVEDGANIPLVLAHRATLVFGFSDVTHQVSIVPTDLPGSRVSWWDRQRARHSLRQPLTREQFYFVMTDRFANGDTANDRGGLTGGRLETGFDRRAKGFYHGGDLAGLTDKLDYIKKLGTTAIWLTPSFVNKPVQGPEGAESAGYHGYWITDFTRIDPHLGTNAEMRTLIRLAHARHMKVFFDIITNHTADVIDYQEQQYTYVAKDVSPYQDAEGNPFDDRDFINSPDFPELDDDSFPYTPVFDPPSDETAKTPAWLNDPTLYHNRGDSTYAGESATYGDFSGLDDLFTERPEVVDGMTDIYREWVDFGIDGFRIDTAKHVNTEFWQEFSPAMLREAARIGNRDFFMFGEVFDADPEFQSIYSTEAKLPATADFGFQAQSVAVANGKPTSGLADLFAADDFYTDTDSNAYDLPTFLGNHDMGRVGSFVGGSLDKDVFAHALMFTLRGQPVVYYGDEQGFIGDGGDQDARQDMFASRVDSYNDDDVIGGTPGSRDRFGTAGPVYRAIERLSQLRKAHPALADGAQIPRYSSDAAGIFAVSRVDRRHKVEYLVVANSSDTAKAATFSTYTRRGAFRSIYGGGARLRPDQSGQVSVQVPPTTVRVFKATRHTRPSASAPAVYLRAPSAGGALADRAEIRAAVPANKMVEASFAYREAGARKWRPLGTDDNAPYRVFHDVGGYADGAVLEYRVVVRDNDGHFSATSGSGVVGDAPPPADGSGVGDVVQPDFVSVPGSLGTEMGCAADWTPDCDEAQLVLDGTDNIWKGTYTLPAGPYAYKAAIDKTWDENYGDGGVLNGANIEFTSDGTTPITFYYDHRTHWATSTAQSQLVVADGTFQSEMGCPADSSASCMRSWLQDPDKDGVYALSTTQVPAGSYEVRAAVGLDDDEVYGAGGVLGGPPISFTVAAEGLVTTFSFDSVSHVLTVGTSAPVVRPDLTTADAYWVNARTIAYPTDRLGAGVDPAWLRYRLHWGDLVIDATSLGGASAPVTRLATRPDGYLALRLDRRTASRGEEIRSAPITAVGVYDDAQRLVDATGVAPY